MLKEGQPVKLGILFRSLNFFADLRNLRTRKFDEIPGNCKAGSVSSFTHP